MKKLLLSLVVIAMVVLSSCSGTKGIEQPTRKVYFEISSDGCYQWQDWRYSSQSFGDWKTYCEDLNIAKTVNPGDDFRLMIKAGDMNTSYRIYMNNKGTLETGIVAPGNVKEIKIKIE